MIKTFFALLTVVLVGCATAPTPLLQAKTTPDTRVYFRANNASAMSTAIFIRDTGFVGSGVYIHLSINGEKAASIDVGEKVTFHLPSGDYLFGVIPTDPFGTFAGFGLDQILVEGRTYTYRILTDGNSFETRIQRVITNGAQ